MKQYPEFKSLNLPEIAADVLKFWDDSGIFEKSVTTREGQAPFIFYEGPPSANGMPGIHHVMARAIKDIFCRYQTLKGFQVHRKAGWDTHGLPIELSVEKTLGITKEDIGKKITIEDYNKACRSEVMKYTDKWEEVTRIMGYWVDMGNPYITYENTYIESVWWLLQQLYKKDMLYKGYTIQPYSPAAGTGLSSHELNQPGCYRNVKDRTAVAMFKVKESEQAKKLFGDLQVHILAWTTTPWTLSSNTALAVGENIEYVSVKTFNAYSHQPITVVLAKELVSRYFDPKLAEMKLEDYKAGDKKAPYETGNTFKGSDLVGLEYEQLLPYVQPYSNAENPGKAFRVIAGDFITTSDGTGIVHIAPTFGADDMRAAKAAGVPAMLVRDESFDNIEHLVPLVDLRGRYRAEMGEFGGEYVKADYLSEEETKSETERLKNLSGTPLNDLVSKIVNRTNEYLSVDERIVLKLELEGKLFKKETYEHNYPHCWRTDKPVLYYPLDSWFIRASASKERMSELNKTINWKPESTGTGRFGEWLSNLNDWNLSRSRFWGIPLPIWRSEDRSEEICVGSAEELKQEIDRAVKAGFMPENPLAQFQPGDFSKENYNTFDLHRPYADRIILERNGKKLFRETDLIDVWFDSGAMPYAQLHYPFENKALVDNRTYYPADFIAEGVDQTRGWFYTLHAIAVMLFDSVAYKNVVSNGLVLDKNGQKMSKRLGNAVDPFATIKQYGPDAVRWYMIGNASPWENLKFNPDGITEVQRAFFGTLYNTYSFFAMYANIDGFVIDEQHVLPAEKRTELDRWILSKLHSLIKTVCARYDDYDPTPAVRAIENFVDEHLSNWYVRLSRRRFWKPSVNEQGEKYMSDDKRSAYETLYECLQVVAQLMSPVAPFFADWLYKNLSDGVREKAAAAKSPLAPESVHLTLIRKADETVIDLDLEARMEIAQKLSSLVLSIRKKAAIRVRQPLQRVMVPVLDEAFRRRLEAVSPLILAEVNVKTIEYITESGVFVKQLKPNFQLLGKRLGALMKPASAALTAFSQQEIAAMESNGYALLNLNGQEVRIELSEVEIMANDIPGWMVAASGGLTVALDTSLTEQLKEEGLAREIINRIQNIRKDKAFEVTDQIDVKIAGNNLVKNAVNNNFLYICSETLAASLELVDEITSNDAVSVEVDDQVQTHLIINKH